MPFEGPVPQELTPAVIKFPPREDFEAWLRSKPSCEIVAKAWAAQTCPIANWLVKTGVAPSPVICADYWHPDYFCKSPQYHFTKMDHTMPKWASQFVRAVDRKQEGFGFGSVTAAECLDVLNAI